MNRRNFVERIAAFSAGSLTSLSTFKNILYPHIEKWERLKLDDGTFDWKEVKKAYVGNEDFLDFNSAGISQATQEVQQLIQDQIKVVNKIPSKFNTKLRNQSVPALVRELAYALYCKKTEIALLRNATEALANAIFGIHLEPGDQVVVGTYDYPHIRDAWRQRAERNGIELKVVNVNDCRDESKIVDKYLAAVTSKTRAIMLTDIINYTGMQIPTRKIIDKLPGQVRYRIVDAAQSLFNTRQDIAHFNATHVGASLHKWLGGPIGSGLLYVREDIIDETWSLMASEKKELSAISKFQHIGTMDNVVYSGVAVALKFHQIIGFKNKRSRLLHLAQYFTDKMKPHKEIKVVSSMTPGLMSNIVLFRKKGISSLEMQAKLWKYGIHTTTSNYKGVNGIRISMNVFILEEDVDRLVDTILNIKKNPI